MIATSDHEFDAIWTALRTVRSAPDRELRVREEVRLTVTPGKTIYMTSTSAFLTDRDAREFAEKGIKKKKTEKKIDLFGGELLDRSATS